MKKLILITTLACINTPAKAEDDRFFYDTYVRPTYEEHDREVDTYKDNMFQGSYEDLDLRSDRK